MFHLKEGGYHDFNAVQEYLYNALPLFFRDGTENISSTNDETDTVSETENTVVYTKETGEIFIDNVSDNMIPEEKVMMVLDVLEHWDECLKQAYEWLRFWDFTNDEWRPSKYKECLEEWTHDEFKKVYEITGVYFEETENKDQLNLVHKYRLESKQKKATYGFSIVFTAGYYPLGFTLKYSCEDMRLYANETYII